MVTTFLLPLLFLLTQFLQFATSASPLSPFEDSTSSIFGPETPFTASERSLLPGVQVFPDGSSRQFQPSGFLSQRSPAGLGSVGGGSLDLETWTKSQAVRANQENAVVAHLAQMAPQRRNQLVRDVANGNASAANELVTRLLRDLASSHHGQMAFPQLASTMERQLAGMLMEQQPMSVNGGMFNRESAGMIQPNPLLFGGFQSGLTSSSSSLPLPLQMQMAAAAQRQQQMLLNAQQQQQLLGGNSQQRLLFANNGGGFFPATSTMFPTSSSSSSSQQAFLPQNGQFLGNNNDRNFLNQQQQQQLLLQSRPFTSSNSNNDLLADLSRPPSPFSIGSSTSTQISPFSQMNSRMGRAGQNLGQQAEFGRTLSGAGGAFSSSSPSSSTGAFVRAFDDDDYSTTTDGSSSSNSRGFASSNGRGFVDTLDTDELLFGQTSPPLSVGTVSSSNRRAPKQRRQRMAPANGH